MIKEDIYIKDVINIGNKILKKSKVHPHFFKNNTIKDNIEEIIKFSLNLDVITPNQKISYQQYLKTLNLINRRANERIPIEYITNKAIYCGNHFYVNENVLVPRSIMSNRFDEFLQETNWTNFKVLDLCTGSGCIGITLALKDPRLQVNLADISSEALAVANANIKFHNLENRVKIIKSDLFNNIQDSYDLIISNPPYVSEKIYKKVPAEFKNEPKIALVSGKHGTELIENIIKSASNHLNPNGKLIIEVGYATPKKIKKIFKQHDFQWLTFKKSNRKGIIGKLVQKLIDLPGIMTANAKDLP